MTRLWKNEQITVTLDGTDILSFTWRGVTHKVYALSDDWELDEDWWRTPSIEREYFALATTTGWLVEIYHDVQTDAWFLERTHE